MRKIGIFGGTFNPVHYGHLRVALECKMTLALDEMRMMICAQPPHRAHPDVTAQQRLAMLQLGLQQSNELILDNRELEREGPSYSVDTLKSLKSDYPDSALFMVIGSDSFQSLDTWHCWEEILDLCNIVIARRPDNLSDEESRMGQLLRDRFVDTTSKTDAFFAGKIIPVGVSQLEISATAIRDMIRGGMSPQYLLPENVLNFIKEQGLYK
ncbi:MAG: nicotinate-nucleotide adenylyltransferase [Gammaproteobacteria bacterium]|nr:nicotinate-nucleotide adenylyltransferase [Gammaproteobacteria bacterium]